MALGAVTLAIIAIFIPPLPVLWRCGCHYQFLITIGLLFLGWVPGIVYAWYIILTTNDSRRLGRRKFSESEYSRRSYDNRRDYGSWHRPPRHRPRSSSRRRDLAYDHSYRGTGPYHSSGEDRFYERRSGYY